MFNPTLIVIQAFIGELRRMYERTYGILEPNYPGILNFTAQLALENIATSDAAYCRLAYLGFFKFWSVAKDDQST